MSSLSFTVYGDPVPQGSMRAFVVKGKPVVTDGAGARLRTWRSEVVSAARAEIDGQGPLAGALEVQMTFRLRRPKKPKDQRPIVRPDLSKLVRAVEDALVDAGVMGDDSQIVHEDVWKVYAEGPVTPRISVIVKEMET